MSKFNDSLGGWGGVDSDLRLGLDVGDQQSRWAAMNLGTGEVREGVMATTPDGVEECFRGTRGCIVLMEAGTHSRWLARKLNELGQRAVVTDPAVLGGGGRRRRKNDRNDARELMELARDVGRPRLKELWQRNRIERVTSDSWKVVHPLFRALASSRGRSSRLQTRWVKIAPTVQAELSLGRRRWSSESSPNTPRNASREAVNRSRSGAAGPPLTLLQTSATHGGVTMAVARLAELALSPANLPAGGDYREGALAGC